MDASPRAALVGGKDGEDTEGGHESVAVLGIDLAKHVFQLHGVDAHGRAIVSRRVSRA